MAYDKAAEIIADAGRFTRDSQVAICDSDRANCKLFASLRRQVARRNDLILKGFQRTARAGTSLAIGSVAIPTRFAFSQTAVTEREGD